MNKKIVALVAFMNMNTILQVVPMSEENIYVEDIYDEYNSWLEDFNEMQEGAIREITLSPSFTNKQVMWYLMDMALRKEKRDFIEDLVYDIMQKNYPHYRLDIESCSNKINLINKSLKQLDDAVLLLEEQFSIPAGQFKAQAIEFAESQDLESFVESFIPVPE